MNRDATTILLRRLGRKLTACRVKRGLGVRALARLADISHTALVDIEAGQSNPKFLTIVELLLALGVTLADLEGALRLGEFQGSYARLETPYEVCQDQKTCESEEPYPLGDQHPSGL
jgi:transcriptional regulator with XRE-family HTH domain